MEIVFLILLLVAIALALGSGYPVAFALPGAAILSIGLAAGAGMLFGGGPDAYFHSGGPSEWLSAGVTNLRGIYWEVERDTLIAIPLFIFMGIMLQRSKIAEDLLMTMAQLFGPVPGGLGISVVVVGALLAATTGIVGATVVAMGLISLPAMMRNNYSVPLATGTIAASGTLGQIIPPSVVLIILADQLGSAADQASTLRTTFYKDATGEATLPSAFAVTSTSAGEMFVGALLPGLLLVGLYVAFILVFALIRPRSAPPVPFLGRFDAAFWINVVLALVPPLALIFAVLGSIILGIATVNQAGAVGAAGALIMASYRLMPRQAGTFHPALLSIAALFVIGYAIPRDDMNVKAAIATGEMTGIWIGAVGVAMLLIALGWSALRIHRIDDTLRAVMVETAKTTSLVFIILMGAAMLTAAFRAFGGEDLVRNFLTTLPGGFWGQFLVVMLVMFIMGFFLDFIEIAVVVVPIVAPILLADPEANVTAVWLGVLFGLNIQTSFLTPPFGFALFYLRGVAPKSVRTTQIYRGVVPFIGLQLMALAICAVVPPIVNYLPNRVAYLAETSPPPRNPRLGYCVQDYMAMGLADPAGPVRTAIAAASAIDLAGLPDNLADQARGGFVAGEEAVGLLGSITAARAAIVAATPEYRPQLRAVRDLERRIRADEREIDRLKGAITRLRGSEPDDAARMEGRIAELEAEIADLKSRIPADWTTIHDGFKALMDAETSAANRFGRAADTAFEETAAVLAVLEGGAAYAALGPDLAALRSVVETGDKAAAEDAVKAFEARLRDVPNTTDIGAALAKVRRGLGSSDRAPALEQFDAAVADYEGQLAWRTAADATLRPALAAHVAAIRDTLGLRVQEKMNRDQALFMASCMADHRDLSLHF
jgi:TRAP-type mannitol/chloroaromatic compound transport system permease large subunit